MTVKVASSRFIDSSITRFGAFYQHLVKSVSSFENLGERLIQEANAAQSFRRVDKIEEIGRMICNIPIREYQLIGQYYIGLGGCLRGEAPRALLEEVVEYSDKYRAKALISIAVIEAGKGDYTSEMQCFTEALKYANAASTRIEAIRGIAVVKAKERYNKQALEDLEGILPLARYGGMRVYHDYLNSLAVELAEANRVKEAQEVCRVVLGSPYAIAYPEWGETGREIGLRGYKSQSAVRVSQRMKQGVSKQVGMEYDNLLRLPERSLSSACAAPAPRRAASPARILDYRKWKAKIKQQREEANISNMSDKDILLEIMRLSSQPYISRQALLKILEEAKKSGPRTEES